MATESPTQSLCWWAPDLTPQERGDRALKAQQSIINLPQESYRRDRDIFNIRLYENNPVITLYTFAGKYYSEANTMALPPPEQSVNNKAKSAIDTLSAQIASTDQRARFVCVDGNYRQRRRAREAQNFTDGLVHELGLHEKKQRVFKDSAVLESGVGVLHFFRDDDRVACERCLATEFAVDPMDGLIDGEPRTLYRRRPMPRDRVRALFGGDSKGENEGKIDSAIRRAPTVEAGGAPGDHIEVFECYHLPTTAKTKDGWHVISLDVTEGVMSAEEYDKPYHPFVFFALEERFTTGWGLSLMTQMRPLQTRINANTYRKERAQKLFHAGHLYVDRAAQMKKAAMSNEIGSVWEGNGPNPPQQILFNAVTQQFLDDIEKDGQLIFENNGISQNASQGETNAGLNASAASKREDTAKSDKRNAVRQQRWERLHLDCVQRSLGIVRDITTKTAEGKKRGTPISYKTVRPDKRGATVIDWNEIAIDEKDYVLQTKAASPVPTDPAGLVAFGERMVEIGAWTPQQLAGYMQDLDADGRVNRMMSVERGLEKTFEALLYDKAASAQPDEFTDYKQALTLGTEYIAQGQEDECPEKHIDRVRRYLKQCKALQTRAEAAAAAQAAAQAPPPGGAAAPMPAAA